MEKKLETRKGDCESCAATDVQLTKRYQNIWMCDVCWQKDSAINNQFLDGLNTRANEPWKNNATVIKAKKVDASIQLRQDIMNAMAVPIKELQAAIAADDEIPVEAKHYTFCQVLQGHIATYQKTIFDTRETLNRLESERYAFQVNLNEAASRLRKEEREKLQIQDITYAPKPVKVVKPKEKAPTTTKVSSGSGKAISRIRELAAKHSIDANMIQAISVQRNLTPEDACTEALKLMGRN